MEPKGEPVEMSMDPVGCGSGADGGMNIVGEAGPNEDVACPGGPTTEDAGGPSKEDPGSGEVPTMELR